MKYAQITLAICDNCPGGMEGFAPLSGQLSASVFADAIEDGQSMGQSHEHYSIFVDLMDAEEIQRGEKCISVAQAARILGLSAEDIVPIGRQRLAQINDEDAARVRIILGERTGEGGEP